MTLNINTAADITRMIGTLASDKAFVLDAQDGNVVSLTTAGVGHRLAKHFGKASALETNTRTIDALKAVLRDNPAYSGLSKEDFNDCFSAFAGGHAVTGARLQAAMQSLNARCADRQRNVNEVKLTAAQDRFREVGEEANYKATLILADDGPKHAELQQKLANLVKIAGGCPQKANARDRNWVVSALNTIVKFELQSEFLRQVKGDLDALPEKVTSQKIGRLLEKVIDGMVNLAEKRGWNDVLTSYAKDYEMELDRLGLSMEDAIETHRTNLEKALPTSVKVSGHPKGVTLSLVRYVPEDISEMAQSKMPGLSKKDIARAYYLERQFGLGTNAAIKADIENDDTPSVLLAMAANPQYLTDKTAYLKGKAELLKHRDAMARMGRAERDMRRDAKYALKNSEQIRLSGMLERGELGGQTELKCAVQTTMRTHFANVASDSRAGKALARQLTLLHNQCAQEHLFTTIEMRCDERIGKLPDRLDPFEFDVSQHLDALNEEVLVAISSRLAGLSDEEAETFVTLALTKSVRTGLVNAEPVKIGTRLDAIADQAKALVAFSNDGERRLFGSAEEERTVWTSFCQRKGDGAFGGEKGLFVKGSTPESTLRKVASVARNMKGILREIAAGGKEPTIDQLHALFAAGVGLDKDSNVRGDAIGINGFAFQLALRSLAQEGGQMIPKLQKVLSEAGMREMMTDAFRTLGDQIPNDVQAKILSYDANGLSLKMVQDYGQKAMHINQAVSMLWTLMEGIVHFNDSSLTVRNQEMDDFISQLNFDYGAKFIPPLNGDALVPEMQNGRQRADIAQMAKFLENIGNEAAFISDWLTTVTSAHGPITDRQLIGLMMGTRDVPAEQKFLDKRANEFDPATWGCALNTLDEANKRAFAQRFTPEFITSAVDKIFAELDAIIPRELHEKVMRREKLDIDSSQQKVRISDAFATATAELKALIGLSKAILGNEELVRSSDGRTLKDVQIVF